MGTYEALQLAKLSKQLNDEIVNSIIQYHPGPGRNSKKNPHKFLVALLDFTAAKIRRDSSTT